MTLYYIIMSSKIIAAWNLFLDIIFPPVCLICRRRLNRQNFSAFSFLCSVCASKIVLNDSLFCAVCGRRLPENKKICHQESPFILAAAGSYQDKTLSQLIGLLKYRKIKTAALPLAEILSQYLKNLDKNYQLGIENFCLIVVPLHWRKQRQRGFNQAELICVELAKNLGLIFIKDALERTRNTASQVELKEKEKRQNNVQNCFAWRQSFQLPPQNIILIDDVCTTGATMTEAAKELKKAGAKKIIGLVAAKT